MYFGMTFGALLVPFLFQVACFARLMILHRQILPDSAHTLLKVVAPNGQHQKVSAVASSYNGTTNLPSGANKRKNSSVLLVLGGPGTNLFPELIPIELLTSVCRFMID